MEDVLDLNELFFPFENVRGIQDTFIKDVYSSISQKKHMVVHAPTGLGKTVSVLSPAIKTAIEKKLNVFFLTSRHTQHIIAVDTLRAIVDKYKLDDFLVIDLIGRKSMCLVSGVDNLTSGEFSEYCKNQKEEGKCEFYNTTVSSNKLTLIARKVLEELKDMGPIHSEEFIKKCENEKLCPYEMAMRFAKNVKVIVGDYNYIFNSDIRETFMTKTEKYLSDSIIIVDEGHNLPDRMRDLLTSELSNLTLKWAIKEAKKTGNEDVIRYFVALHDFLLDLTANLKPGEEKLVSKEQITGCLKDLGSYFEITKELSIIGEDLRELQKKSFIGSVSDFLKSWILQDEGYARIITKKYSKFGEHIILSYKCLDPSISTKDVILESYSTVIMSGTLNPTYMYKDLLGFPKDTIEKVYGSPFEKKNRLNLVIPKTTTKFTARSEDMFKSIAKIVSDVCNTVPGNSAVFFPSYFLRDKVNQYFESMCRKTTFLEMAEFRTEEKQDMLTRFKDYSKTGAVLLAVSSGNFSEGIDLPGDYLKCVVVVGLPLNKPDLETESLIKYYDTKFNKGWDYGYIFPAMNKCLQSAGRCIRSETDRGVIVFLDERFIWQNYMKCFPKDWDIKIDENYLAPITHFFSNQE